MAIRERAPQPQQPPKETRMFRDVPMQPSFPVLLLLVV